MKKVFPDYYPQFQCIAGACRHNCCIGWEIDIDYSSMRKYLLMKGPMGDRLRQNIEGTILDGHFILDDQDRCPLLNSDGLCDLILEKSEKSLCQICRDHPRFRLRLADREEIGLGLCCEAACRLILDRKEPVKLILTDDGKSKAVLGNIDQGTLKERDRLFAIAQDRSIPIQARMEKLLAADQTELPDVPCKSWIKTLLKLEQLDESWMKWLRHMRNCPAHAKIDDIVQEQLLVYFLYRYYMLVHKQFHYYSGVVPFCVLSTQLIVWLCEKPEDIYEVARMYSAEIEYSYENIDAMLSMLDEYNGGTEE